MYIKYNMDQQKWQRNTCEKQDPPQDLHNVIQHAFGHRRKKRPQNKPKWKEK